MGLRRRRANAEFPPPQLARLQQVALVILIDYHLAFPAIHCIAHSRRKEMVPGPPLVPRALLFGDRSRLAQKSPPGRGGPALLLSRSTLEPRLSTAIYIYWTSHDGRLQPSSPAGQLGRSMGPKHERDSQAIQGVRVGW